MHTRILSFGQEDTLYPGWFYGGDTFSQRAELLTEGRHFKNGRQFHDHKSGVRSINSVIRWSFYRKWTDKSRDRKWRWTVWQNRHSGRQRCKTTWRLGQRWWTGSVPVLLSFGKVLVLENPRGPIYKSLSLDHKSLSSSPKSLSSNLKFLTTSLLSPRPMLTVILTARMWDRTQKLTMIISSLVCVSSDE